MTYNSAIIGCGRIGCGFDDDQKRYIKTHAGAYTKCKKTQLIALCDVDPIKLEKYGKKYKISKLYSDYRLMFLENQFDIISICTHAPNHHEIVKECVRNGIKGIFIEKPISNNLQNSLKILELCKKNKIKLVIDYQREYIPSYQKLKKLLDLKRIGNIQKILVNYGGGVANTGSHIFDILLLFFGPAKNISSKFSVNQSNNKQDPNLDIVIEFKEKIICNLNALDISNYGILEMDIFGTKGRVKMDMVKHCIDFFEISKKGLVYNELKKGNRISTRKENEPILKILENLLVSIEKKSIPLASLKQGHNSLELIIGAMMSAQQNKTINFPIKNKKFKIHSK